MNAIDADDGRAEAEHKAQPESADNENATPEEADNDDTYYLEAYEAHQGDTLDNDYSTDGGEVVFMNELLCRSHTRRIPEKEGTQNRQAKRGMLYAQRYIGTAI
ncbi:hypothetical protein PUNSTDRAFT_139693 [Punctularia strigosozonata HHB-11173 SS5]|uniref:Uncharacterized protein n=1 Tax=Punctularia strigosozonata (strain HHB-11173) TaxID=741275 RepID=R7S0C4_PUNST|nr:uncharacterized protein PUNSTDRAFT_139693 [Punctularia strigosozonata HHB-11173 SS5]EIN03284.1 hypothetical protein PUNSTDRAFT_139693 [Punctularia strigosozonata HHB-11173 SS5]